MDRDGHRRKLVSLAESLGVSLVLAGISTPTSLPLFHAACSFAEVRVSNSHRRKKRQRRDAARPSYGKGVECFTNDVSGSMLERKSRAYVMSLYRHLLVNGSSVTATAPEQIEPHDNLMSEVLTTLFLATLLEYL